MLELEDKKKWIRIYEWNCFLNLQPICTSKLKKNGKFVIKVKLNTAVTLVNWIIITVNIIRMVKDSFLLKKYHLLKKILLQSFDKQHIKSGLHQTNSLTTKTSYTKEKRKQVILKKRWIKIRKNNSMSYKLPFKITN